MSGDDFKQQGNALFKQGKYQEAIDKFTEGIAVDSHNHVLFSNRSASYANLKQYDQALEDAEKVIALQKDWPKGYSRKALALSELGRKDEAAIVKKTEGNMYFKAKDFHKAKQAFSEGIALDPKNHILLSNRSAANASLGFQQAALADALKAMKIEPTFLKAYTRAAGAYMHLCRYNEAIEACQNGQKVDPDHEGLADLLNQAFEAQAKGSATLRSLFGDTLYQAQGGAAVATKNLAHARKIAVYFSAHWCPPCRQFTPMLVKLYAKLKAKGLEVVFASNDKSQAQMQQYIQEEGMQWLTLKYGDSHIASLSRQYGIQGIPALIVLNANGTLASNKGVAQVQQFGENVMDYW